MVDLKKKESFVVLKTLSISELNRDYTKEEKTEMFPVTYKYLKKFRERFGDDVKVTYIRENYIEVKD
tara:strand:+ start:188 stop:388 length:201 start_codon:yes stop_codon:yes gene_type:complete